MKNIPMLLVCCCLLGQGCKQASEDSPVHGHTRVVADETLFPVVDALDDMFESTYPKTTIDVTYLPESRAFQQFIQDSTLVIVSARKLTPAEAEHFKRLNINPRTAILANDAVALLVNPSNPDTNLRCDQVKQIFQGAINDWHQVSPANKSGGINLVFDHQGSSTVSFIRTTAGRDSLPPNSYALANTEAVVNYVASHPNAVGIIGYSWLSDFDDPVCRQLNAKVKVMALSPCDAGQAPGFYKPFATNVLEKKYPFSRQVFVINRETKAGLGTGFSAYIAGQLGQRIISKTGILPAYVVDHNIELKSDPFRVTD